MKSDLFLRSLGASIRALRGNVGLTQHQLGSRAGIGGKYVSEIERGTRDLPLSTLHSIVERGLQLQLDIAIRGKSRVGTATPLPRNVEEIALLLAALPMSTRDRIVEIIRTLVELAKK